MQRWYLNLSIPSLLRDAKLARRRVVRDANAVYQFSKSLVFQAKSILPNFELLLAPIVPRFGTKYVNQCLPSVFDEALHISVSIDDDGLTSSDENVRLIVSPLDMLMGPQLTINLLGI